MIKILPYIYVAFPSYGIMATIGLCAAVLFLYCRLDKVDLSFKQFLLIIMGAVAGLLVGSRILFVIGILPTLEEISLKTIGYYLVYGGIVFYGGLLGMLAGVYIVARLMKKVPGLLLDFIAPAIPLFHGFARIGCLLSGCCYGIKWNWGVRMVDSPEIVRFPVQLAESFCDFIIFICLIVYQKKSQNPQNELTKYLCSYAICRFVLEFFRGDTVRGIWIFGVSTSQIVSIIIIFTIVIRKLILKTLQCKHLE